MNDEPSNQYPEWGLLSAWVAVVESESVSLAARRLGLSQAAVSMRIKLLETKLNTELLDRSTRPAKVTLAGRRLYESTTPLLRNADEMLESVRGISRAKRSVVRLGCIDSFAATVGPVLFRALSNTTQQVRLWSGLTPSLMSQFVNRQLDMMITTAPEIPLNDVAHLPLFSEQYLLVMPASHTFRPLSSISDLAQKLPLIRYSARSNIGEQIDKFLALHADHVERTCEFDTSDPLLSLVAAGIGFAITTPMCIWQSRHFVPQLRMVPLDALRSRGRPYAPIQRTFYLTYRPGEMGKLPKEVEHLTRIAMGSHIAADMETTLGLPRSMILSPVHSGEPSGGGAGDTG
ncbi:LysR family transcriptional regulator [Rhodoferax sp. WC2427]|uniref:LysR family transcriptional regulator n=1 Tax=Rhodoferax sp. WC2427 TaxID=3234144 RepID=UPI00346710C8